MTEKMLEALSAAVDDEAGKFELRRLLDEAGRNGELRGAWMRYHAIGAVLRGEWQSGGSASRRRVDHAPHAVAARGARHRGWQAVRNHRRGRAIAASLAAAATMAVLFALNPPGAATGEPNGQAAGGPLTEGVGRGAPIGDDPPAELERLHAYTMRHLQHRAMHGPGVSSFTKYIAYTATDRPWQ